MSIFMVRSELQKSKFLITKGRYKNRALTTFGMKVYGAVS